MEESKIKSILLEEGYVSADDISRMEEDAKAKNISLLASLLENQIITKELLGQAMAEYYGVPFADLEKIRIDEAVLAIVPELVARNRKVVAFGRDEKSLKLGMVDPEDFEIKSLIEKRAGQPVAVFYVVPQDLENSFSRYKASLQEEFKKITKELERGDLSQEERDEAIVRMVDVLILGGYENKASDVHIEPYADKMVIRLRIDGVMHDVLEIKKEMSDLILSRIKVMARMRTDEHRKAQDGKFRYETSVETFDIRVSIVPVAHGENVVMRLLAVGNKRLNLHDLGLSEENLSLVNKAAKNPHGMILVTGPTGSGKTTTLYAVLNILNTRDVHIATIEDPVEYDIESITQIQVDTKTNLTFAKGLRAIVRQDPDIIMVGEIRDEETADIAINSALTGHLVLSTLHTNDSATALPRFLDMGIEPFLIASTVNIVIAQRLVRQICTKCRVSYNLSADERKLIEVNPNVKSILKKMKIKDAEKIRLYRGAGCKVCGQSGYTGRVGIFEVLEIKDNIKELIIKRSSSDEIMKVAVEKNGMSIMLEDGLKKAISGETTIDEVLRVVK